MAYKLIAKTVASLSGRHKTYWDSHRAELFRLKQCYETRIWEKSRGGGTGNGGLVSSQLEGGGISIEVPVGYEHIEGIQAALFTRQPGCVVRAGITGIGSPEKAEALLNNWTARNRQVIESASRLALIYPMSFVKLAPQEHTDPLRRVTSAAVCPWDVIVDRDAQRWDEQRFCGHIYYLPLPDAEARFRKTDFEAGERAEYWDQTSLSMKNDRGRVSSDGMMSDDSPYFQFIKVVELYDFVNDKLIFWSPNWHSGDAFLDSGPIPFRNSDGSPANNIIPFYYNHIPDRPLDGYSSLRRIYDQALEMNIIRSFQANAVRKCSRQWIIKKGALDEDQMSQLIAGVDGAYVECDTENLDGIMRAVPHTQTPPELESYYNAVRADKDRGSIMAPFTRGEATRSSATEIAALVAYTSSEIGRMARERDEMIELMCRAVLNMYKVYLGAEPVVLFVKGKYISVNGNEIADDFNIFSEDNASTPVSDAIRKSELLGATNLLMGLGVPQPEMLKEIVRTLNLPESFLQGGPPAPPDGPPGTALPSAGPAAAAAAAGSGAGSPASFVASMLDAQKGGF